MKLLPRLWLIAITCGLLELAAMSRWVAESRRAEIALEADAALRTGVTLLEMRLDSTGRADPVSVSTWRRGLERLRHSRHLSVTVTSPGRHVFTAESAHLDLPGIPDWFVRFLMPSGLELERRLPLGASGDEVVLRALPEAQVAAAWRELRGIFAAALASTLCAVAWVSLDLRGAVLRLRQIARAIDGFRAGAYRTRIAASGRPEVDAVAASFNRLAGEVARSEAELGEISQRALAIREDERRHLAHELHDGIGQSISAIKALAVSISRKADPESGIVPIARMIADVSSSMYDQVRQMMDRLRPTILDELGLVSALDSMIDDWNAHHDQSFCAFERDEVILELPPDMSINVFRIVQEALTNVAKHAAARSVSVRLVPDPAGMLLLEIADDGAGFDPALARRGLGLVGIEERARAVGGTLRVEAAPGRGARIEISIPLVRKESHEHGQLEAANPVG